MAPVGAAPLGLLFGGVCLLGMLSRWCCRRGLSSTHARSPWAWPVFWRPRGRRHGSGDGSGGAPVDWRRRGDGRRPGDRAVHAARAGLPCGACARAAGRAPRHAADLWAGAASGRTGPFQWLAPDVTQRINTTLACPCCWCSPPPRLAVLGMLLHDVEDRQATDQALKDSSARLRAIATALPTCCWCSTPKAAMSMCCPRTMPAAGAAAQLRGRRLHELLPAAQADPLLALIRKTLRTGQTESFVYQMQTLSACAISRGVHVRWARSSTAGHGGFLARDISEARRGRARCANRAAFSLLLRDIPSISVGLPARRHNHLLEQGVGGSVRLLEQEALGKSLLDLIIPAEMQTAVQEMQAMFARGTPHPAGRAAPAAQGRLARGRVLQPHRASRCRAGRPNFLHRHRHPGRKAAEEEARYLAFHDALTGCPTGGCWSTACSRSWPATPAQGATPPCCSSIWTTSRP